MSESIVNKYREIALNALVPDAIDLVVSFNKITSLDMAIGHTTDGVHYRLIYYDTAAQQVSFISSLA